MALTTVSSVAITLQHCPAANGVGSNESKRGDSCCSSYLSRHSVCRSKSAGPQSIYEGQQLRREGGLVSRVGGCAHRQRGRAARVRSLGAQCAVQSVTEADFETEVLQSPLPVLVDFWDTWCGPCKLVSPLMDWAAKEYDGKLRVVKIQADPNPSLVQEYKVYGLPCFIFFEGGKEVLGSHLEGAISKAKLKDYIDDKLSALAR